MSAPDPPGVEIGCLLEFDYPEKNRIGVRPAWKRRRVIVERIVDTLRQPIDPRAVQLHPHRRRGRWLIIAHDIDRRRVRSFYWEVMRHVRRPTWLHVGLYDPLADKPAILGSSGPFAPTQRGGSRLAAFIGDYRLLTARDDNWLSFGVFPWEGPHDSRHRTA